MIKRNSVLKCIAIIMCALMSLLTNVASAQQRSKDIHSPQNVKPFLGKWYCEYRQKSTSKVTFIQILDFRSDGNVTLTMTQIKHPHTTVFKYIWSAKGNIIFISEPHKNHGGDVAQPERKIITDLSADGKALTLTWPDAQTHQDVFKRRNTH